MRPVAGLGFTGRLGRIQSSYSALGLGHSRSGTGGIWTDSCLALESHDLQRLFCLGGDNKIHDLRGNSFLNSTVFIRI